MTDLSIQAIETKYKGYRFRSRLEARWAVFFDALHIPYRYEPLGVRMVDSDHEQRYLPDFLVGLHGAGNTWFEIKPYIFQDNGLTESARKALGFMTHLCYMPVDGFENTSFTGFITAGDPGSLSPGLLAIPMFHDGTEGLKDMPVIGTVTGAFAHLAICPCCNKYAFFVLGTKDDPRLQVLCGCIDAARQRVYMKPNQAQRFIHAPVLTAAAEAARSARFEHGETPRVPRGRPR